MGKILLILGSVAITTFMFVGCANSSTMPSSTQSSETSKGEQTNLVVSTWDYSSYEYQQKQIAAFEKLNSDIKITVIESPSAEYDDKIQIMLSGGENVDVVFTKGTPALSALTAKGQVLALNDYIEKSGMDVLPYSGLIDQLAIDGSIYGIPYRKDNNLIFYNKDLFDSVGVEYPKDGMTMEEYRQLAAKITSGEGADKIYGAHVHTWASNVNQFARRTGVYDPFGTDKMVLKDYYDVILKMQNEDKSVMDFGSLKAGNVHYSGVFYNQQVAMMQMGTWFINMLAENVDFNWGVCSLPDVNGTGNKYAVGGVTPVSINTKSKNPDAAWRFLQYVTSEEGAIELAKCGILPGYSSDAVVEEIKGLKGVPENIGDYLSVSPLIIEVPMHPNGREVDKIITEEHELIMTNSISVEEGITNMKTRVNEIINKN